MKTSKLLPHALCLAILLAMPVFVSAQVFNGDLILLDQEEVDAFNYTEVTGLLSIGLPGGSSDDAISPITSLLPLASLIQVGSLTIRRTRLVDIVGLENLMFIEGNFEIVQNTFLKDLKGLSGLSSIGGGLLFLIM